MGGALARCDRGQLDLMKIAMSVPSLHGNLDRQNTGKTAPGGGRGSRRSEPRSSKNRGQKSHRCTPANCRRTTRDGRHHGSGGGTASGLASTRRRRTAPARRCCAPPAGVNEGGGERTELGRERTQLPRVKMGARVGRAQAVSGDPERGPNLAGGSRPKGTGFAEPHASNRTTVGASPLHGRGGDPDAGCP